MPNVVGRIVTLQLDVPTVPALLKQRFATSLVRWQKKHGRHHLPWQGTRDPYCVWLSEVMLQQTQVAAVLGYYPRFLARFPTVQALAAADVDEVLGLWSGLGYYRRAHHLHQCAKQVVSLYGGKFPETAAQLQTLPGIGRSTAAAIAAFCFSERAAILDANVKRVLTRVLGFSEDLSTTKVERTLWTLATQLLPPASHMAAYTQGLMDLGSLVCTARQPACSTCPVQDLCVGHLRGQPVSYPVRTGKLKRSQEIWWLLCLQRADGSVWLERRPSAGIWGGLYCFPTFGSEKQLRSHAPAFLQPSLKIGLSVRHALTHKDLLLKPVWSVHLNLQTANENAPWASEPDVGNWFPPTTWAGLALPAPIKKMLAVSDSVVRTLKHST